MAEEEKAPVVKKAYVPPHRRGKEGQEVPQS